MKPFIFLKRDKHHQSLFDSEDFLSNGWNSFSCHIQTFSKHSFKNQVSVKIVEIPFIKPFFFFKRGPVPSNKFLWYKSQCVVLCVFIFCGSRFPFHYWSPFYQNSSKTIHPFYHILQTRTNCFANSFRFNIDPFYQTKSYSRHQTIMYHVHLIKLFSSCELHHSLIFIMEDHSSLKWCHVWQQFHTQYAITILFHTFFFISHMKP